MTNDHWLGIAFYTKPAVYTLDNSTKQFNLMQTFDEYYVNTMQISADHQYLVMGNENGVLIVYKLVDGKYEQSQKISVEGGAI